MKTITLNDEEYTLEGEPSMGVVKYVQQLQIEILRDHISDEQIAKMDSLGEEDMMDEIISGEGGIESLESMMWQNNLLRSAQTIILATNHKFDLSEFDEMAAMEFKKALDESKKALGTEDNPQDAQDFMQDLGVGISSQVSQVQRQAQMMAEEQEQLEDSQTNSQSQLLSE